MKKILIGVAIFLITITTTAQEFKTLDTSVYSIQYPDDWKYSDYNSDNGNFMLYTELEGEDDRFSDNVNLVIQDIEGMGYDLASFTKISESQVEAYIENPKIISSDLYEKDGKSYQRLVFQGSMNGFDLKFVQQFYITPTKSYVLTFTSEQNQYEKYAKNASYILESFTLK